MKGSALGAFIKTVEMQFVDRPAGTMGFDSFESLSTSATHGYCCPPTSRLITIQFNLGFLQCNFIKMNGTLPLQKVATYRSSGRARPPCLPSTAKSGHGHELPGPRHVKRMHAIHSALSAFHNI